MVRKRKRLRLSGLSTRPVFPHLVAILFLSCSFAEDATTPPPVSEQKQLSVQTGAATGSASSVGNARNESRPPPEKVTPAATATATEMFGSSVGVGGFNSSGGGGLGESAEAEKQSSLAIFFILFVLVIAILVVHAILVSELHFLPESLAIVLLGAFVGAGVSWASNGEWSEVERLSPHVFFLVLLPPIIFESGYNLNKDAFFAHFAPVLSFAVLGTVISTVVIGGSLYILGLASLIYRLPALECFAFAAMVSAVDPVATLAIFQAVKVSSVLYMLVWGESMLNDAVSIVLANTATSLSLPEFEKFSLVEVLFYATVKFVYMFVVSAVVGAVCGLLSALLFKHIDLRRTPSLELALLMVFAYLPYGAAEAASLSGIMAILVCGMAMSQFTSRNISPVTQLSARHMIRTLAFVCETSTFAYLGMAFFTIQLNFQPMFIVWTIVLCLVGRALNIFSLSHLLNRWRGSERKLNISMKTQIIMWFSGMRGAVCFALALYLDVSDEHRAVILTTTLCLVLASILLLGGFAMPFISFINRCFPQQRVLRRRRRKNNQPPRASRGGGGVGRAQRTVMLSKTQEMTMAAASDDCWANSKATGRNALPEGRQQRPTAQKSRLIETMDLLFIRKFTELERRENAEKLRAFTSTALRYERPASANGSAGEAAASSNRRRQPPVSSSSPSDSTEEEEEEEGLAENGRLLEQEV